MNTAKAPAGASRWGIIALAVGAGVVAALQVGKVPPALPLIAEDLELSRVTAGLVASLFFVVGAVFGIATGVLADRFGERRLLFGGFALMAVGSLIGGLFADGSVLLATRVIEGLGYTAAAVAAPKIILAAAKPSDHPLAIGIWSTFMPLGMAIIMALSPALLGTIGWQGIWLVNAAVLVIFAMLLMQRLSPARWTSTVPAGGAGFDWPGTRQLLARPGPWLFSLCFALYTLQWFAVMAWLPTFLVETQGRSLASASLFGALVVLVNVLGNIFAAWVMHKGFKRWPLVAVAFAAMGVAGALIFSADISMGAKIPLAIAFSSLTGLLPAACLAGATAHAPSQGQIAMANGFVIQGATIGSLLGPPLMGAVATSFGSWEAGWWIMFIGPAIGLGVVVVLLRGVENRLAQAP
ncbi:MAG: MFS transporter [Alphaproteobacteria bacterium]|jgi:MFS transporter, DHA1 family, inner membrane transport protein|nr:MFS transporter [Alphaproteobacteria bacterium]